MCGIAGTYRLPAGPLVKQLCDALAHRGPDDSGFYADETVALGMRRLSILDLSPSGHQPMTNEDGTVWMVYNGEIYNFRQLRERLRASGHVIRSTGDAETVIHLYEEYGLDCFRHVQGMFALAIWDTRQQRLVLARDRLGIKPLFYAPVADGLMFASELPALLATGAVRRDLNPSRVGLFLFGGAVRGEETIIRGVSLLPPGSFLCLEPGSPAQPRTYWRLSFPPADGQGPSNGRGPTDEREVLTQVRDGVKAAVRDHLISDVGAGVLLSGGIDSSLIALLAAQEQPDLQTFSIGYTVDPVAGARFDETAAAGQLARHLGTDHHVEMIDARLVADALPDFIAAMGQPTHDGLNVYFASRLAARHTKVILSGLGSDELFAGYSTFKFGAWLERLRRLVPVSLPPSLIERLERATPAAVRAQWPWRLALGGLGAYPTARDQYWLIRGFFERAQVDRFLGDPALRLASDSSIEAIFDSEEHYLKCALAESNMQRFVALELAEYLRYTLLPDSDVMSMAHSVELRVPFLDARLVDLVSSLPPHVLQASSYLRKRLLIRAFADVLPQWIINRPKKGFALPLPIWMNEAPLRDIVEDCLSPESVRRRGLLRPEPVGALLSTFRKRPYMVGNQSQLWLQVWQLVVLELWCRQHLDMRSAPALARRGAREGLP